MTDITCEEMIEELKRQFPTFTFKAGTVGFGVFQGHKQLFLPYTTFNNPNFPDMFAQALTAMELTPCACGHDNFDFDGFGFGDARPH